MTKQRLRRWFRCLLEIATIIAIVCFGFLIFLHFGFTDPRDHKAIKSVGSLLLLLVLSVAMYYRTFVHPVLVERRRVDENIKRRLPPTEKTG